MLAADKEQGNMREDREDEKLLRVFVKVPKSHTEEMIQDYFKVLFLNYHLIFIGKPGMVHSNFCSNKNWFELHVGFESCKNHCKFKIVSGRIGRG